MERVDLIHSEIRADMETVKTNPGVKTNVFVIQDEKADLINRLDITRTGLIDRMDFINVDLINRINKLKGLI